jgi:GNAT superfamily N-acetyltransferase
MSVVLRPLLPADIANIARTDGGPAWKADKALWEVYLAEQEAGRSAVLMAFEGERVVGYGALFWESKYGPFREAGVAEINNLVTAESERGQGIATHIIEHFEGLARVAGRRTIGLGVGLYGDYGVAQRLYSRLGYRPDGNGITYAGQPVTAGSRVLVDDDLLLWLTKDLSPL